MQRFVGALQCGDRIGALLGELGCLRIQKALNLQTISRHSFTDSKIVKLLSLGDHRAEECGAHASTKIARDIEKSRAVTLLLPK